MTKLPLFATTTNILPCLALLLISLPLFVISQSLASEMEILLNIKKHWNNQPPTNSWNSTTSPCDERLGIDCADDKTVTGIFLRGFNISGTIPPAICDLKNLILLDLSYNSIQGGFPTLLYNCSNLQRLDLSKNLLVGHLPNDIHRMSPQLQSLDLSYNNFTGHIPSSIGKLNVTNLNLSNNRFSGQIPPVLARLTFDNLDLSANNLSGKIPSAFHDRAYATSFMSNPNLCSNIPTFPFHKCSSKSISFRHLTVILLTGAAIILLILSLIFSKVIVLWTRQDTAEQPEWKMIPFHKLNFTKEDIVQGLTEDNVIGSGGAGKIYCVAMDDSGGKVAVKKIWNHGKSSNALEKQFIAEVEILGSIRHTNIVKLWCCVSRTDSKLLVYEYMENSSLDKWLHRKNGTQEYESSRSDLNQYHVVLDWPTRLRIAIGAAKGLCYMHHDCSPPIIHRDVKSSNILLDSDFNAKIADFGLAKMSANNVGDPYTVSAVAGSFGYIAPEYWCTRRLNEKIDIFSFGVVLLELATGKEPCKGNEHLNLADWSWQHYCKDHPIEDALDNEIKEPCFLEEMKKVFQLGLMCTNAVPTSRPPMKRVLQMLTACSSHEEAPNRRVQARDEEDHGITPF